LVWHTIFKVAVWDFLGDKSSGLIKLCGGGAVGGLVGGGKKSTLAPFDAGLTEFESLFW
jgi:hypothetical protein